MRKLLSSLLLVAFVACPAFAQLDPSVAKPPVAKKVPRTMTLHGETLTDNYFWLREKTNPEVIAYLEAENAYTAAVMKTTEGLQEALYNEMLGHIKQTDLAVPYKQGDWFYYSLTEEGKQYPIQARKRGSLEAKEEVILDLNELAKGQKYLGLGGFTVSDDGNLLAYSTDVTGFREYTLHVKDLRTGKELPDTIAKVQRGVWASDNRTLFYVTEDKAKRPYRLYRHALGEPKDTLVYEEADELYRVSVNRSLDKKYLFASSGSSTATEVRALPSDRPAAAWRVLIPREPDHEYHVDHRNDLFYIRTNKDAKNFRLVVAPVNDPEPANWVPFIPHRPDVLLENVDLFARHAVLHERAAGLQRLRILDFTSGASHDVEMPEPIYSVFGGNNAEFDANVYRFQYTSLVTPPSVFDYDMDSKKRTLRKQTEVPGGFLAANYTSERIFAPAADGTKVPISLVYKKGVKKDGTAPLLLYGYGAYGASMGASFNASRLSLLDRGVIYAIAHIRGGKEMGQLWHDQGKMLNKRNTFTDFIACADHLIAQKYTNRDKLAIEGGSAGGLLIGAVLNLRPDLCRVAVLHVPFVDVINTMLDESLPLTVQEFLEWGNPKVKKEYDYLKTYCPYTNLVAKSYPSILVRTSLNDSQVMYWEPAKYVAKLRTLKTDKNPLLLKINMAAGHGGSSGRYDALKETASTYAFLLNELGLVGPPPRQIADKQLETAIRAALHEPSAPLTDEKLLNVYVLEAPGKGIKDLAGLERCKNLALLRLSNNQVVDVQPLKDLVNLQSLDLAGNQIADAAPLAGLTHLQYLELSKNRIAGIEPLKGLTNLSALYLSGNQVSDLKPLSGLARLSSLYLDHNKVSDLTPLSGVTRLSSLDLKDNQIKDVAPLAKQTELRMLFLERNQLADLTVLVNWAKADAQKEKRFAPYLRLYIAGNPLTEEAKTKQVEGLKSAGVRIEG